MKYFLAILLVVLTFGCFPVRHCKYCTFSKGIIHDTKANKRFELPHWNDSVLVFVNQKSQSRDTFLVEKKKLREVDKSSIQIENSSKDYLEISLSLTRKRDTESFRLYWGQYTCKDNELEINISVFDFWDWVTMVNDNPSKHTINKKEEQVLIGGKSYRNVWVFTPNIVGFPIALDKDIQKIYWNEKLGLLQYESKLTGVWYREGL